MIVALDGKPDPEKSGKRLSSASGRQPVRSGIVLSEPKSSLDEGIGLADHSGLTRAAMKARGIIAGEIGPKSLRIDGCDAVQYELQATRNGQSVVYLNTCLDRVLETFEVTPAGRREEGGR